MTFAEFSRQTDISKRLFSKDDRKIGYLRETANIIAKQLNNDYLISLTESDIYWDEIKKIEKIGIEDTYDISVDKTHNFIANDIIVHNSHAVSYALIGYQTAYLKAHYPIEFSTSLFNADSGDIERIAFLVNEAKKAGIRILPPDINKSFENFMPEESSIRFGLLAIKNVGVNIVEAIIAERMRSGPFQDFNDFLKRVQHKDLNKKSLESLIKAGVFDSLGVERNSLLLNMEEILSYVQKLRKSQQSSQDTLFGTNYSNHSLKLKPVEPASNKEKLLWEKELLGFFLSDHPLNGYKTKIDSYKAKPIKNLIENNPNGLKERCRIAGIICKTQRILTKVGRSILFAKVEDLSGSLEIVVFSDALSKNPAVWRENNVVVAQGWFSWRNNEPKFICEQAVEL